MAAPLLETPSRVLRRVIEAEDVELPSLPSIVDYYDQTSDEDMSRDDSELYVSQTPIKPLKAPVSRLSQVRNVTPLSDITASSNNSGPLFPPESNAASSPPSSYAISTVKASTSTPVTVRHSQSSRRGDLSEFQQDGDDRTSTTLKTAVYVPDELSLSFDGLPIEEHQEDDQEGESRPPSLASSTSSHGAQEDFQSQTTADTPPERRLSNVLLTRPHRRAQSNRYEGLSGGGDKLHPQPRTPSATDRIPSLSRSSDDESSVAAHTPENAPRATFPSPILEHDVTPDDVSADYTHDNLHHVVVDDELLVAKTPSRTLPHTRAADDELNDRVSDDEDNSVNVPLTPAPRNAGVVESEPHTPRPGAGDAEWRKQHVLAVLQSTARKASRGPSAPPVTARIKALQQDSTPRAQGGRFGLLTPVQGAANVSYDSAGDASFVSVASSADLTSDRRASAITHHAPHRGNTSFPNILLPTGLGTSNNAPEHRVDGAKLQKHLNAMNKQLVEENRELALALQQWQFQAERQRARLRSYGDDENSMELPVLDDSLASMAEERSVQGIRMSRSEEAALLQEMAEKLELLEEELRFKEAEIDVLKGSPTKERASQDLQGLQEELATTKLRAEEQRSDFAHKTEKHAKEFQQICDGYQSTIDLLKAQPIHEQPRQVLSDASKRDDDLRDDEVGLSRARDDIKQLQDRFSLVQLDADDLRKQVSELQAFSTEAAAHQQTAEQEAIRSKHSLLCTQADLERNAAEMASAVALSNQAKAAKADTELQLEKALNELDRLRDVESDQERQIAHLEDALNGAERQITADEQELLVLRAARSASPAGQALSSHNHDTSGLTDLHQELDRANREVGRLQQRLDDQSTSARAQQTRLGSQISSLQSENAKIQARLDAVPQPRNAFVRSPASGFSPVHQTIAALRTPGPLREMSWMNTTSGDPGDAALRAHIDNLQAELVAANVQLDGNFSRLEAAGASAVTLADRLAIAERRAEELETQLAGLSNGSARAKRHQYRSIDSPVANRLAELQVDMKQERERLQRESARLRTTISMMQDEHAEALRNWNAELVAAKASTEAQSQDLRAAQAANDQLMDQLRRGKSQAAIWEATERQLRAESSTVKQTRLEAEKELRSARETMRKLSAAGSTVQGASQSAELAKQLTVATQKLRNSERSAAQLLREKQSLAESLADFDRELQQYRVSAGFVQEELKILQLTQSVRTKSRAHEDVSILTGQIRYLKAKFTREATFRNALCLQKRYLLLLVGGMSLNEKATLAAIASMGFPTPAPPRKRRTLRSVVLACIAISRARNAAESWATHLSAKHEILASRESRLSRQ